MSDLLYKLRAMLREKPLIINRYVLARSSHTEKKRRDFFLVVGGYYQQDKGVVDGRIDRR
jgi:hypothetical protein